MSSPFILYYAPDNASLCVRLALLALDLPYQTRLIDRAANGQSDPAYLAQNPNGVIPTLLTPDGPIYETGAILLWLSDQVEGGFMPANLTQGQSLSWLFWLSNTLHPAMRMWFYPEKFTATQSVPDLRDATRTRLKTLFAHLETHATWLDDPAPSALGCYLAPLLRWAALYGPDQAWFDLAAYPKLLNFAQNYERHPSAKQASHDEGLGDTIFSNPTLPNPPEGTAL